MSKYNWKNIKGVGLGIVAFEATEHLANIISEVRDTFDYVTIGLQRLSYHGDPIDPTDLAEILRLRDEDHLVDTILEINLDTSKEPRVQETDKRNLLIQDIEDHGCSHALIIDSDEYYTNKNVLKALVEIDANDYELTYCQYANYYHDYNHFLVYPFAEGMYVPFITKTKYRFSFESIDFPKPSDPTRRYVRPFSNYVMMNCDDKAGIIKGYDIDKNWESLVNAALDKNPTIPVEGLIENIIKVIMKNIKKHTGTLYSPTQDDINRITHKTRKSLAKNYTVDFHIFPWEVVKMHHLSCIRADIRKKFNDWSSKTCFDNYNDLIDKAVDAYNNFNENSKEQQIASLLFGTPGHEVYVRAWPKQYIYPKYNIMDRYKPVKKYKKIAIMNLSSTNSKVHLFEELEKTCKETWAKDVIAKKYENIDYWTVIDTKEKSYIDKHNHTIYINTDYSQDNVQQLLNRWLDAFELLEKNGYNYEWVLRTNTSTWCNIDIINEFLANEIDDSKLYTFKLFSAFWSTFYTYMSGAGMLWHVRNIRILANIVRQTAKSTLDLGLDDVIMSALWRQRANTLKLSNPNNLFHSLEGAHVVNTFDNTDFDSIDLCIPMLQIKTYQNTDGTYIDGNLHENRIINDIAKMKKLQELWDIKKESTDIEKAAKDLRENKLDKTINIIPYSKAEWLAEGENAIPAYVKEMRVFDNIKPYNEETLEWLENRAKECGYNHTK
ncbi:MAG: hypothetical protein [Wendovervirus sonii]|uniref:Uncharacterized protein n=1 Tax=phage Lak_Megaphage_Sonny TaxID=3109229 RepID=A0ABZ0Z6T8_9CAUD|nr:MAG: hypothetical protein [phage Lak_Megaphage_Sonny]